MKIQPKNVLSDIKISPPLHCFLSLTHSLTHKHKTTFSLSLFLSHTCKYTLPQIGKYRFSFFLLAICDTRKAKCVELKNNWGTFSAWNASFQILWLLCPLNASLPQEVMFGFARFPFIKTDASSIPHSMIIWNVVRSICNSLWGVSNGLLLLLLTKIGHLFRSFQR